MRLSSTILWASCLLALMACETPREADLLVVTGIDPTRITPERMIRVQGSGFPPGREAVLRFDGTMRRPGAAPTEVSVELRGRAIAAEEIEARFTPEALERFGGRGTLHGRVIAIFDAADGRGRVIGRSPELEVDVVSATVDRLHGQLARRREAAALLDELGLSLADESPDAEGLPIMHVRGSSIAERAGLMAGDRLIAAEGVRTHDPSDVLASPGEDTVSLRFSRPGEAAPFVVLLPTGGSATHDLRAESVRGVLIALAWVLFVGVLLAPTASLADWIASAAHSASSTRRRSLPELWKRYRREIPATALGLLALACLPALDRTLTLGFKLEAVVLGLVATRVGATWLGTVHRPLGARLVALVGAVLSVLAVGLGLGAVSALGGTTDLAALSVQAAAPWDWTLLRVPISVPVLGLVCLGAAWRSEHSGALYLPKLIDDMVLLVVAAAAVGVLVGGWGSGTAQGPARLLRGAQFVGLSFGLWLWMRRARRLPRSPRTTLLVGGSLGLAISLATIALVVFEPASVLTVGVARVLAGAAALLIVSAMTRLASGRLESRPKPLHRFA